jgi:hypothetical protein
MEDIFFFVRWLPTEEIPQHNNKIPFGITFVIVFHQILNFFFIKIKCGLYFLDRFDVLMSKMIFKK